MAGYDDWPGVDKRQTEIMLYLTVIIKGQSSDVERVADEIKDQVRLKSHKFASSVMIETAEETR